MGNFLAQKKNSPETSKVEIVSIEVLPILSSGLRCYDECVSFVSNSRLTIDHTQKIFRWPFVVGFLSFFFLHTALMSDPNFRKKQRSTFLNEK